MAIMGESARDLNPIISQGSDILKRYAQDAQDTSYVLSTEQVAALAAVDEKYQELQLRQEAVRKQLASEFAPTAEKVYDKFGELVTEAGEALKVGAAIYSEQRQLGPDCDRDRQWPHLRGSARELYLRYMVLAGEDV